VAQRRREARFKPNQTATVRVLTFGLGPLLTAAVLDISGSGMRLRTKLPIPCGVPVEVEVNHMLSRGNVRRCNEAHGFFELGIQVSETAPLKL